jgi:hypothetical protein
MGKSEKFLILGKELSKYVKVMGEASDIIHDQDVSNYPIFVAHQQEVQIGLPIVEKEKNGGLWNIHASTLEEFVAKSIIHKEKIDEFRRNYKDPKEQLCIFVLSELGAQFVYLPR